MTREEELAAKRARRLKRWFNSLTPEKQVINSSIQSELVSAGLVDDNGLTETGELRIHQLELLEWMRNKYHKGG